MFESICSADLLGHKVMVPCNYRGILNAEYGANWVKPDRQSSLRTYGDQIYWSSHFATYSYQVNEPLFNFKVKVLLLLM